MIAAEERRQTSPDIITQSRAWMNTTSGTESTAMSFDKICTILSFSHGVTLGGKKRKNVDRILLGFSSLHIKATYRRQDLIF